MRRDTRCSECQVELARGSLLRVESDRALCLACADLDDFEYLPRGDAALTRRARAHSTLQAVVPEWSRCRQRYERQGVLVGSDALRKAEEECLGDADLRSRRRMHAATRREAEDMTYLAAFAAGIGAMFPGCPANEATQIAAHACRRYSPKGWQDGRGPSIRTGCGAAGRGGARAPRPRGLRPPPEPALG